MYTLYIIQCRDGSLYTGIARDLDKRLARHAAGKGSRYVASRLPFKLVFSEEHPDRSTASKRENEIKSWTRAEKIKVISSNNETLKPKQPSTFCIPLENVDAVLAK